MTRKEMAAFERVARILPWWAKVDARLQARGEPQTREMVTSVHDALQALSVHLHYETIDGAGKLNDRN